ncbi:MAG: deaminase [Patescibacteria group bacterium]
MLNEEEIFNSLFKLALTSKDKEGAVAACIAREGKIIASSASSDNSSYHAEYLTINKIIESGNTIKNSDILYVTVEPCSKRQNIGGTDCCSYIINNGIKNVIFAVSDPKQTEETQKRLKNAGVRIQQIGDENIIRKARDLFNKTMVNTNKYKL